MSDTTLTADEIVANAQRSLDELNEHIDHARTNKIRISKEIARLLEERKPLARIVSAAKGRKAQANGD